MAENEAMKLTNDYVFKRIFGHVGNEEITRGLTSAILNREVKKVELDGNPILEKDLKDDKVGVLDIKAKLDNNENCDIEMQIATSNNIGKRIMFYWSKLYSSGISEGEDYNLLNKTIAILIANFELEEIKEIPKYHTKWEVREEEYSTIILTNVLEIHIIELKKLINGLNGGSKNEKLDLWLRFIINPDEIGEKEMVKNKDIKQAKEELDKIQADKHEQYLAHLRLKHILDTKATEEYGYLKGKKEGEKKGRRKGIIKGKKVGMEAKQREIVLSMVENKLDIETICKITKLSKEEVEKIDKEAKKDKK